jgi:xanthine dehydrogenase accessory factor
VQVEGSSYRRVGARLLISAKADFAGAISGGCLEAEVIRKAQWKVRSGAIVERYSTLFDDTADIPYGLGCGGTVDLLLEPAGTAEFEALMQAMQASLTGKRRRIFTQLPEDGRELRRCILDDEGAHVFRSRAGVVDASHAHFAEFLEPPQRLFVFGAGDDAQPLVTLAAQLGWRVFVVDGRSQWSQPERFPEAEFVGEALPAVHVEANDSVVVMTHSYEQDRAFLASVLPSQPRYLGLLGARHRSALLLAEAAEILGWPIARACEHVFAPMGLDLGGEGAEAIALATAAEIQACLQGKLPTARRMSADMVEHLVAEGGASRYLQARCAL